MGIFLICVIAGSSFARSAVHSLDDRCKAALVTIVSKLSWVSLVVPLAVALAYAVTVITNGDLLPMATVVALGILVAHGIVGAVMADRAYRAQHFPPDFMRLFRISRAVRIVGSLALFSGMLVWIFSLDRYS